MPGIVNLRDVLPDDLPLFYEHQREPKANQMTAFPARNRADFDAHWAKILADPGTFNQTILYDGQVAGNIGSYTISGEREVGYWLGQAFWGQGIATRALAAFLEKECTRPLYAHVAKRNPASLRVLQKCGFTIIGEDRWSAQPDAPEVEEWFLRLDEAAF